ncbi:MAG: DUF5103 domain-containing protein [Sphingobacteriaceae bacterium]|nr:DUF5103 domain-containing protein [Sphingobacteriaceae bacterium]
MLKKIIFIFLCFTQFCFAQNADSVYENRTNFQHIKTVQCYNTQKEQSIPIYTLGSSDQILLSFDDLKPGFKNYWYTIEHCNSEWKSSNLYASDYLDNFQEDEIVNYQLSSNTIQNYTHYELLLPNNQIKPRIAGNYIIIVYEDRDRKKTAFTQRFYVTESKVLVAAENAPSQNVEVFNNKQKINFSISNTQFIQNPFIDLKIVLLQNYSPKSFQTLKKPNKIKPNSLIYDAFDTTEFLGGNEYRKFDIRSLRFRGDNVELIVRDSINTVHLLQDQSLNKTTYSAQIDEDGNFFIRTRDANNNNFQADYAKVIFNFKSPINIDNGHIYVVGRFNNFQLNEENKLKYNPIKKTYQTNLLLKQGLYDYKYVWASEDKKKINNTIFEGSYFETGNTYQIFIYYKKPGNRWETLIGHTFFNTINK